MRVLSSSLQPTISLQLIRASSRTVGRLCRSVRIGARAVAPTPPGAVSVFCVAAVREVTAERAQASVTLQVTRKVSWGEHVRVVGSAQELGGWDVHKAPQLSWTDGHVWTATVKLPAGQGTEFKFVVVKSDGSAEWEKIHNRTITPAAGGARVITQWNSRMTEYEVRAIPVHDAKALELLEGIAASPATAEPQPAAELATAAAAAAPGAAEEELKAVLLKAAQELKGAVPVAVVGDVSAPAAPTELTAAAAPAAKATAACPARPSPRPAAPQPAAATPAKADAAATAVAAPAAAPSRAPRPSFRPTSCNAAVMAALVEVTAKVDAAAARVDAASASTEATLRDNCTELAQGPAVPLPTPGAASPDATPPGKPRRQQQKKRFRFQV